jgi:alkylation response protein AidB-like acyl-CoA dehydrogenase
MEEVMSYLFKGLERLEEARERIAGASFMAGLYEGRPDFDLLLPPEEPAEERAAGEAYCKTIQSFLTAHVDPDEIERTAKIPDSVLQGLFKLGAFGMKIPKEYGGLGFSYKNYGRVLTVIASWSNILALTVAVPQSIGIAMPILLFGNEQQKKTFLPRVAREDLSAFALTEPITGSDAANIRTEAVLDSTGQTFVVNGEKLWCTNGTIARYVTLIARVPARHTQQNGKRAWMPVSEGKDAEDRVHTAFILDMTSPGVQIRQRCQFEGCRGIENAHMTFRDVHIPADNLIGEIGKGLNYALTILNVGRAISIPALCLGMAKQAWQPTLDWANERYTFQKPLAERQTQQMRIGDMATTLFAMESLAQLVWHLADQKQFDIRIEAAIAKLFCSEETIRFLKDAQIIFGGMGYETAESKRVRGEPAFGIEQLVRDAEMNRIGEGATDILKPYVAREGLNSHLERARNLFNKGMTGRHRFTEFWRLLKFYVPWYGKQWTRRPLSSRHELQQAQVRSKLVFIEQASRRLARAIFYAMIMHRQALRDDQGRQNRIEAVGEDLLAIAATALNAESQERTAGHAELWELADELFRNARQRIDENIRGLIHNRDELVTVIGKNAFSGKYPSLSDGVVRRGLHDYLPKQKIPPSANKTVGVASSDPGNRDKLLVQMLTKRHACKLYTSMAEAIQDLIKRGFTANFEFLDKALRDVDSGRTFEAKALTIVEHHRFEGASDPDEMSVVYAVEGDDGTKGIIADAFGVYANPELGGFLNNVTIREECDMPPPVKIQT